MTDKQYSHWDQYVRLIEHTWNTTVHSLLGVSPFEAAHGLPAVSVTESLARGTPVHTVTMSNDSIQAMQCTAKACVKAMELLRQHDKQTRANKANEGTRHKQTFKVGDRVSFFIPAAYGGRSRADTEKSPAAALGPPFLPGGHRQSRHGSWGYR